MRDSLPSARYPPICNVLRQWKTSLIPIYRVYRLYDGMTFEWDKNGYIIIYYIYASAQMPRAEPLQLKAAACQTFTGNIPGKPWRPIARIIIQVIIIIIIILRMRRRGTDIYIYIIYTHRESLVRKHEPCAKALSNKQVL